VMNLPVLIREISAADADAAARLSEELGYPVSAAVMEQRIEALNALPDHAVYVACFSGETVGWIHVMETRHLTVESRAEAAHRFYLREGYRQTKTSAVFAKELAGSAFGSD
jgi:hypothetical protein